MNRLLSAFVVAVVLAVPLVTAFADGPAGPIGGKPSGSVDSLARLLTKYNIAVFGKGPNFATAKPEEVKARAEGMKKSVAALVNSGMLVGAVQVHDAPDAQYIFFFKTDSLSQVTAIVNGAPNVAAGVFKPVASTVWGTRGLGKKYKANVTTKEDLHMVILSKGASWRDQNDAETREKVSEATDYVWNGYKNGNVRFFAMPDDKASTIRLLLIGKGKSLKNVADAVNATTTVKSGWFKADVFKVTVLEGILP